MKCQAYLSIVLLMSVVVNAVPYLRNRYVGEITAAHLSPELSRTPYHSLMLDEYHDYAGINDRMQYSPELSMATFVSNGPVHNIDPKAEKKCVSCEASYGSLTTEEALVLEKTEQSAFHIAPNEELDINTASLVTEEPNLEEATTQNVKTKTIKPKQKPIADNSDEDEHDNNWPIGKPDYRSVIPASNAFFPIVFGYPGFISRSAEGPGTGGATAIANSFSTGKGGVATSHATAYGDPGAFQRTNWKRKSQLYN